MAGPLCAGDAGRRVPQDLQIPHAELVLRKGYHRDIDSYSAFFENDRKTRTGLAGYLRERGLTRVFLAGLASTSASAIRPRTPARGLRRRRDRGCLPRHRCRWLNRKDAPPIWRIVGAQSDQSAVDVFMKFRR